MSFNCSITYPNLSLVSSFRDCGDADNFRIGVRGALDKGQTSNYGETEESTYSDNPVTGKHGGRYPEGRLNCLTLNGGA